MFVFAYGSLLNPESLSGTLPGVDLHACVPARSAGWNRTFGVAFPNDGSAPDKSYRDADGIRPPVVLFYDLGADPGGSANGVCVPVDAEQLELLRRRELRYELSDVTDSVHAYENTGTVSGSVFAFTGMPEFRTPPPRARGVVSRSYLAGAVDGARHWDTRAPGFFDDFIATSRAPGPVVALTRSDAGH